MKFNLFYKESFLNVLAGVYKLNFLPISERVGLPILTSKLLPSRNAFVLPFGFYQTSEYLMELGIEKNWNEIQKFSIDEKINVSMTAVGNLRLDKGLRIANNPILDLKNVDDELSHCSQNHRQNIRKERNKAARNEIVVSIDYSIEGLRAFYDLLARQYVKDHKMVFQPFSLYFHLMLSGWGVLFLAKADERIIGGMFCLQDGEVFHYNWGAREYYLNINIGTLLIDYAVTYAATKGFRYFDFGSTPLTDDNLYSYKMKWGSENFIVYKYYTLNERLEIDLNESFGGMRALYSHMPIPLAKVIMPYIVPLLVR